MGSTVLGGSSACLEIAYCGPFVRDNWVPIVVKYVAQIGADGSNSDTCHSPGRRGGAGTVKRGTLGQAPAWHLLVPSMGPCVARSPLMWRCRDT